MLGPLLGQHCTFPWPFKHRCSHTSHICTLPLTSWWYGLMWTIDCTGALVQLWWSTSKLTPFLKIGYPQFVAISSTWSVVRLFPKKSKSYSRMVMGLVCCAPEPMFIRLRYSYAQNVTRVRHFLGVCCKTTWQRSIFKEVWNAVLMLIQLATDVKQHVQAISPCIWEWCPWGVLIHPLSFWTLCLDLFYHPYNAAWSLPAQYSLQNKSFP